MEDRRKKCVVCGAVLTPKQGNFRYCPKCRDEAYKRAAAEYRARQKARQPARLPGQEPGPDYNAQCRKGCRFWAPFTQTCDRYILTG